MIALSARLGTRWRRGQRGVALLEFVIVFPLLVTLVFSIWEAGRIFDAWLVSTNAAREGARYAITTTNDSTVQTQIQQYLTASYGGRLNTGGGDVTIDPATDPATGVTITRPGGASGPVTVAITAGVEIFAPTPFTGFVGPGGNFYVHAWTTMQQ